MKKFLFFAFALVAGALAFTSCDPNNPNDPKDPTEQIPASEYDGIWVSDSILNDNMEKTTDAIYVEVLNAEQVLFHSQMIATYKIEREHFFTLYFPDSTEIHGEIMFGEDNWLCVDIFGPLQNVGIWSGAEFARLYMYHLPQPEGDKLPVTEANILGKWRTTYEINSMFDNAGNKDGETKFYHGWQIWDIQANGVATAYSNPYSYNGWWALDGDKLALYNGTKPATMNPDYFRQVELYSNFMHITHITYRDDHITPSGSNEQFLYRVK